MPILLFSGHMIYLLPTFPLEEAAVEPSFREVLRDALRVEGEGDHDECIARIWSAMAKGTRTRGNPLHTSFPGVSLWGHRGTLVVARNFRFYPYVRIGMKRERGPTEETGFEMNYPAGYLGSKPGARGWIFSQEFTDCEGAHYGRPDDLYIYLTLAHRCRPFARRKTLMRKAVQIRQALPHVMRVDPVELAWRGLELEDEEKFAKSIELKIQGLRDAPL
jgi:hypothetical protein